MNKHLYEQLTQLKKETIAIKEKVFKQEKELKQTFKKDSLKLKEFKANQTQMIHLLIGGKRFSTTITTLSKYKSLFSPYLPSISPNDTISIDHSPSLFNYIIEFMREETIDLSVIDTKTKSDLLDEAIYFECELMRDLIQSYISTPRIIRVHCINDVILGSKSVEELSNPLSPGGFATFHQCSFELEYPCEINSIQIGGFKGNGTNWNPNYGENFCVQIYTEKGSIEIGCIPLGFGKEIKTMTFSPMKTKIICLIKKGNETLTISNQKIGIGYFVVSLSSL